MATNTKNASASEVESVAKAGAAAGFEMSTAMREAAETGIKQVKDAYESCRSLADDATGLLEESFVSVNDGLSAWQTKALEASRKNVDAGFDFFGRMLATRSLSEAFELQTRFARERFDAVSQQMREFQELSAKMQMDAAKPFREGMTKAAAQLQRRV